MNLLNDDLGMSLFDINPFNIMIVDQTQPLNQTQFVISDFGVMLAMGHREYDFWDNGTPGYVCPCITFMCIFVYHIQHIFIQLFYAFTYI